VADFDIKKPKGCFQLENYPVAMNTKTFFPIPRSHPIIPMFSNPVICWWLKVFLGWALII